jgi:hypothetical protein
VLLFGLRQKIHALGKSQMIEWLMIASMGASGICFAIGGTGFRFVRFAIMPLILGLICFFAHVLWWHCLGMALCLGAVLTFGDGEKVPYWRKILVYTGCSLSTIWIGLSWWQVFLVPLSLLLYVLSNWKLTASIFPWKICEFGKGFLIGAIIAQILSRITL